MKYFCFAALFFSLVLGAKAQNWSSSPDCADVPLFCGPVPERSVLVNDQPPRYTARTLTECENFEYPAPPGDVCALAPFFCGNFLDGYCSGNAGLGNDTLAGNILQRSGFLRLAPCSGSDSLLFRLLVRDCAQGDELVFHLVSDACGTPEFISSIVVPNGVPTDFFIDNLMPDSTYYLVFEGGPSGAICEFFMEVIAGIGTATPGIPTDEIIVCDCTDATIGGPDSLCPGDIANFFIASPGFCDVSTIPNPSPDIDTSHLGNGYFCCPESEGGTQIVWHIPSSMNFLSDSVGVDNITVQVDSNLLGIDTLITDSIWFSFEPIPNPFDTLVFCNACGNGCVPGVKPKKVTVHHEVEFHYCFLSCYDPICQVGDRVYFNEGTDTIRTNCLTTIVLVIADHDPPFASITPTQAVLTCNFPVITLTATTFNPNLPAVTYTWSGPGIVSPTSGPSILVNQPGLYICTTINEYNGCTSTAFQMVLEDMTYPIANAGVDVSICIGQSVGLSSGGSSSGGVYTLVWNDGAANLSGPNPVVSPTLTTSYVLNVKNQANGCSSTDFITVTVVIPDTLELGVVGTITCQQPCVTFSGTEYCAVGDYVIPSGDCEVSRFTIGEDLNLPMVTLPPVTLCEGECYDFYGQQYCASTTVSQEDACVIFVQQIIVQAPDTLELGVVGTITCQQPCVTFSGTDYCAAGDYVIASGDCEVSRFTIGEDLSLPTVTLPPVTLCEGECYDFYGQQYCASTTVSQEDACVIFVQQIIVQAPDTLELGVVGTITCQQPCVTFSGTDYCAAGTYLIQSGPCEVSRFTIGEDQNPPGYSNLSLNCLPDNQQYRVSFFISGTPPYKVNGTSIPGSYYQSAPIVNGESYAFVIEEENNACQTVVSGAHDCSFMCSGNPGTMESSAIQVCIGEEAVGLPLNPPQPAAGQAAHFILHTLPGTTPGTILAENTDGVFSFNAAAMIPEQVYYISSAIGVTTADGALDFSNLCTRIGPGQALVFHKLPRFGEIVPEDPSCFGTKDGALNILSVEGAAPHAFALDGAAFGSMSLFENLDAGAYGLSLRDANGCLADTVLTLTEPDSLWLSLGPDKEIIRGEAVLLQAESNIAAPMLSWSNNQNTDTHDGSDWLVQPSSNTVYNCVAQDEKGCAANAEVLLKVKLGKFYYPNALNRNSTEAANRAFTLFAREGYIQQIKSLKIFDRWGALAFQRTAFAPNLPELGWDGKAGDRPVNSGVFVFVAEVLLFDGTVEVLSGDVTVF